MPWGHWVALDCFVPGDTVNGVSAWSHVLYNNGGPTYQGWISDYYLSERGSTFRGIQRWWMPCACSPRSFRLRV